MSVHASPNIVEDGLVLCLDAGNERSYPGTGTTWSDLSGNGNDGTLVNGPTYDGGNVKSIALDGIDDYVGVSNPQALNPGLESFSVDAWLYQKDNGYNGIVEARGNGLHGFLWILNYPTVGKSSLFLNTTFDSAQNIYQSSVNTFSINEQWFNTTVVVNRDLAIIQFYKNGIKQGNNISITSGGTTDPGSSYRYFIGGDLGGPEANINISLLKHYSRALSQDEIKQNFNALRGRFGL